jgi:hypothetical protein
MDDKTLILLNSQLTDKDLLIRLLGFANHRLSYWDNKGGHTGDDIVSTAIEETYDETRHWYPDKISLEEFLLGVISSLTSNKGLLGRAELQRLEHRSPNEVPDIPAEGGDGIRDCDREAAFAALKAEVSHDKELTEMVTAIELDGETPSAIASLTGFAIKRIYELRRKLEPYIQRAAKRLQDSGFKEAGHATN